MERTARLFLDNIYIMQENERLRKTAKVLMEENKALKEKLKERNKLQEQLQKQAATSSISAAAPNPNFNAATPAPTLSDLKPGPLKP
ncbi:hypothetical protein LUZ63_008391 [Rhynchospora breviuscula]|uniref:Uncharacterized protein n=1 Tax=Rhynchospora breviuscula TaxID=2022672 RepID=A0A9Q0CTG3_9POAL|nr:hypothetical protein LUZ63_008391 [Rhynchospora breviuscula]